MNIKRSNNSAFQPIQNGFTLSNFANVSSNWSFMVPLWWQFSIPFSVYPRIFLFLAGSPNGFSSWWNFSSPANIVSVPNHDSDIPPIKLVLSFLHFLLISKLSANSSLAVSCLSLHLSTPLFFLPRCRLRAEGMSLKGRKVCKGLPSLNYHLILEKNTSEFRRTPNFCTSATLFKANDERLPIPEGPNTRNNSNLPESESEWSHHYLGEL